jgi:Fic family protein
MHATTLKNITELKDTYDSLKQGKESLLTLLEEAEMPESVYNSNAIENSTLTLDETERLLLYKEMPVHHSQREVFEAVNLAKVTEYLGVKLDKKEQLNELLILNVHETLLTNIHDKCAGRYRKNDEHVRIGTHIAPPPAEVPTLMEKVIEGYHSDKEDLLQRIVNFHLEFERIHPFLDGNGRTGRALITYQLKIHGYPPVIVPNKGKHNHYYPCFVDYEYDGSTKPFELLLAVLLKEALHKRITYLKSEDIVLLSKIGKEYPQHSPQSLATLAKKQSLPAFRERGRWKVGKKSIDCWDRNHAHSL